jgi:Permeases of the drug/metabolite transporter (DMT) superfamily
MDKPPPRSALLLAFASIYLIWGSTYLGIRIAIETMPLFLMAGARFLIAGALLYAILRWRGAPRPTFRQWRIATVIGTFLLLGGNGLVVWAEQFVPSGITALIIGIQPLFFVLTEWAWPGGLRPSLVTAAALLLGFAGVAWLAAPWETSTSNALHLGGVSAILLACVSWAFGSIYSRHSQHGADPLLASSLQMLTGGSVLLLVALLHGDFAQLDLAAISADSWWAFSYLLLFGSLVGFSTFVWLMKHSTPARVSTYAYVNPLVAVFLGWLIRDEPVTVRTLICAAVIVTAVVIITAEKNRAPRPAR